MPVDVALAAHMRAALRTRSGITETVMMGGTCFFRHGHMLAGARRDKDGQARFMFRVGKAREAAALAKPEARPVVHGARKLGGFVHLAAEACDSAALHDWLDMCLQHADSLPAKEGAG